MIVEKIRRKKRRCIQVNKNKNKKVALPELDNMWDMRVKYGKAIQNDS